MKRSKKSRRTFIVFLSLVSILTATSALLLVMAPAPLRPDATAMSASETAETTAADPSPIFNTASKVSSARWKYIYIHQSNSQNVPADSGDHFVITGGDGAPDGQIQMTQLWDKQLPAAPPAGAREIDPACISICVVGNFNRTVPTMKQLHQVVALTNALRAPLNIAADHVLMVTDSGIGAAGVGKYFPADSIREQMQ